MVVVQADIQTRLSGGSGNINPFNSLGGAKALKQLNDDTLNNLWDNTSKSEQQNGDTEYRCVYFHNNAASDTLGAAKVWFTVASQYISLGVGTAVAGGNEQTVANESTAPSGVNFVTPISEGTAAQIGSIPPASHKAIWIRRIIPANAPQEIVLYRIKIQGSDAG
jgi:hypothetical protein